MLERNTRTCRHDFEHVLSHVLAYYVCNCVPSFDFCMYTHMCICMCICILMLAFTWLLNNCELKLCREMNTDDATSAISSMFIVAEYTFHGFLLTLPISHVRFIFIASRSLSTNSICARVFVLAFVDLQCRCIGF
jgi:hypothetical protein